MRKLFMLIVALAALTPWTLAQNTTQNPAADTPGERNLPDSINIAWRNASFRGYADYMQTPEFERNLEKLIAIARERVTAIMCAEAVPWRCHRSLVADTFVARGIEVQHLQSATRANPHRMTPFAVMHGGQIVYAGLQP